VTRYHLLPGLRWRGKLRVLSVDAGGIAVEFDAETVKPSAERYIYDRAVLTPEQFRDWTGEEPPAVYRKEPTE